MGVGALHGHFDLATRRGLTKFVGRGRYLRRILDSGWIVGCHIRRRITIGGAGAIASYCSGSYPGGGHAWSEPDYNFHGLE